MPLLQTKADASAWGYGFLGATASTSNFYQIQQLSPSAVSTVTFSSIPSTYKSLQVRFNLVASAQYDNFGIYFNGDTTTNYACHGLRGNGASASATGTITQNYILINSLGTYLTYPTVGIVDVIDYANTNKNKTIKALSGINNNSAYGAVEVGSGLWLSTAAINSLTVAVGATFTGTVTLYGAN